MEENRKINEALNRSSIDNVKIKNLDDLNEFENILEELLYVPNIKLKTFIIDELLSYYKKIKHNDEYKFSIFIAEYQNKKCGFVICLIHPTYKSYGKKCGIFGWLHCSNNFNICKELIRKCEEYVKNNNVKRLRGNINIPKNLGGFGIQIEGFHEQMLYGVPYSDPNSRIPQYLEELGYKPDTEYISMLVTKKMWNSSKTIPNYIRYLYLSYKEITERIEEFHNLIAESFHGQIPIPDSIGKYRLLEILEIYPAISKKYRIPKDYDAINHKDFSDNIVNSNKYDLKEVVPYWPLAFDIESQKLVGAVITIPDFYEYYQGNPITRVNVDTVIVHKDYTGKGIFSGLNNIGQLGLNLNGVSYFEGTSIWNKNPEAVKAFFPHGITIRKFKVFQKRIKQNK